MEPDEIRTIRRAADQAEEALQWVVGVAQDAGLPSHQREELDVIAHSLKDAAVRIGNMCDLAEADLQRARRT
jgi:Xaa-Pro aminopeptidase